MFDELCRRAVSGPTCTSARVESLVGVLQALESDLGQMGALRTLALSARLQYVVKMSKAALLCASGAVSSGTMVGPNHQQIATTIAALRKIDFTDG